MPDRKDEHKETVLLMIGLYCREHRHKLLKNNGSLVLLVPAHGYLFSNFDKKLGHFKRYSKMNVRQLLENADFKEIKIRHINWWGAIGWFVFMKLSGRDDMPRHQVKLFDYFARIFLFPERMIRLPFGLSLIATAKR